MASNYHMQNPYVLATLPRSLAQPDSKAVVGEVCGLRPGAKKRRRPEVAVGIDGEAANLYDIASSRLITSYPVPPQAKFSCPPCSLRLRSAAGKKVDVARYTYISTREPSRRLSLFKDTVGASGATSSATVTANLGSSGTAVVFLGTVAGQGSSNSSDSNDTTATAPDLLTVEKDGKVAVLDGETLQNKYQTSVAALSQDLLPRGSSISVELAQTALATDVLKGLQLGEEYLSGFFARKVGDADDAFNPDMLLLVTTVTGGQDSGSTARYLHVLAVDPEHVQPQQQTAGRLVQVHHVRLPAVEGANVHTQYCLDVASGSLAAIEGETVVAYDLAHGVSRISSQMAVPGVTSFLRLSKSSILAATPTSFSVYNPLYSSLQASADMTDLPGAKESSSSHSCSLIAYFSQLELAVALVDSHLVAVQLEPPRTRSKKRRADGLLIDSIGRGVSSWPGHISSADIEKADRLVESGELADFDDFLAEKLGITNMADWRWQRPLDAADSAEAVNEAQVEAEGLTNSVSQTNGLTNSVSQTNGLTNSSLVQPSSGSLTATTNTRVIYPEADRHWVVYAIGRVLAVDQPRPGGRLRLRCTLPESDIVNYLVDAGHLSVGNVRSALRVSLQDDEGVDDADAFLGEALPVTLAHIDPSLDLLLRWLYATKLGATELLSAILLLMRSLELVAERQPLPPDVKLLTNGEDKMDVDTEDKSENDDNGDDDDDEEAGKNDLPSQELDRLEQQLRVAEYFLEHVDNDPRDLALDMAIGKLGSCPAAATVAGLRRLFRTDEIRSLIEVLRKQLVDQGWATRYLDPEESEAATAADGTPLNYSIRLIADLLGRCIDSVRPGEWLIHDETATASEDTTGDSAVAADFFASLKWQVSAALEGVQEALYLRGILGEAVRYSNGVQAYVAGANTETGELKIRPERVDATATSGMLPLGLKAPTGKARHQDISLNKVVAGGEVLRRTKREMGHLTSKKVGAYTLERIVL